MKKRLPLFTLTLCLGLFSFFQAATQCGTATVNQPGNQVVCVGNSATAVNFTSAIAGTTYKWTNDNTAIGLAASGNGDIAAFTATNTTSTPITATITVTPYTTTPYAYIPNQNDDNVSVIDLNTRMVVSTIPVGDYPQGVAVSPDGTKVYVTNYNSNNVSVINTATNTVTATIGGFSAPFGIAASPDGTKLYVANNGSGSVSVVNTTTNTVISSITVGSVPQGVAVSPDGAKVYVTNYQSNTVSVINTTTNTVTVTIGGLTSPYGIAVSPDGTKLYISRYVSNIVWVINTVSNIIEATITTVGPQTGWIASSPDGAKLYVSNYGSGNVAVINTADNTEILPRIAVGNGAYGISLSPDGTKMYVSNYLSNSVSVINTTGNTIEGTVGVGNGPAAIGKAIALVTCPGTAKTFTITVNPTPVATITYGSSPYCATGIATPVQIGTTGGTYSSTTGLSINAITGVIDLGASTPGTYMVTYTIAASGGCAQVQATASVTINVLPTVTQPSNQIVCNSSTVPATTFSSSPGASFSWTNSNPAIGLPASGTGSLPSFTATNATGNLVTSTITVTPLANRSSFAYVANSLSNNVSVISTTTNTIVATVAVGNNPYGISVSPDGSKVYVTNYTSNNVSVIATATNTVVAMVAVGNAPTGISVSPDGSKVYVANGNSNNVSVISTATNTVVATIAVGIKPLGISVSPDGSRIYVANLGADNVSVIATATNAVTATIGVGGAPRCVSISPDGNRLYVINYLSSNVSVINTATNTVSATVAVGSNPFGIAVSPDGNTVYVTNGNDDNVSVISAATATVTATVAVGSGPRGISVSPDGTAVYVVNYFSDDVSVITTATNVVTATVAAGDGPILAGYFIATIPPCTGTPQSFTITVNPTPSATVNYTASPYCAGTGTATPTLTGTTGGTYSSTAGLSINTATGAIDIGASAAGTYTVTYTVAAAGGCSQYTTSASVTINPTPATPIVTLGSSTAFCAGGSVLLTSSATTGNQWYKDGALLTGATPTYTATTSGSYTVRSTENACPSALSAPITVTVTPLPAVPVIAQTGNVLSSTALTGNQWLLNNMVLPGATAPTYAVKASGLYIVQVTVNGCTSTSTAYNFVATRIDEPSVWNSEFIVYPNPVKTLLHITNPTSRKLQVQLYNCFGKKVYEGEVESSQNSIYVQGLASGMYQVILTDLISNQSISQSIFKL